MQGKQVLFMTNNSMKSRQAYLGKFVKLGVPAAVVSMSWINNSTIHHANAMLC
jgi:ribonucleotide monophosphatase NagD (HAD superfamily)